jgi:uncharacterized protein (TIGR02646 family)
VRFIEKGAEPARLRDFKRENRDTPELLYYSNLTRAVRDELHARMLSEQGRLCAYTMLRIGVRSMVGGRPDFHVEHIQPQAHVDRGLDYDNMVLCASKPVDFGAYRKGDANVDDRNFISPLSSACERRLRYRQDGEVRPAREGDGAARHTIDLLNLNHAVLAEERAEAIRAQGLRNNSPRPISAKKSERLARDITAPNGEGNLAPFCAAIKQVAERFAQQRQKRAARASRSPGE